MSGGNGWAWPRMLAHRGGGALAPENTLAAFDAGHARGYRAAEFDAVLTQDEVPVLLHDERVDRTSNGRGSIARLSLAQVRGLDAGSWFGPAFAGERIPTLEEVLAHCRRLGTWLNVEIKPTPGREERTGTLVARTVAGSWPGAAADAPLLSSFSPAALSAARKEAPHLARALLVGAIGPHWRETLQELGCTALHCDHSRLTRQRVAEVRAAGWPILCYTVNDAARLAQLREWGVEAACTDRIDRIPADALG